MKWLPRVIDIDLINELKRAGRYKEVETLLKTFHKDVKKAGRLAKNDFNTKIRKIDKHKGICTNLACYRKVEKGKAYCDICHNQKYNTYRQRYKDRKAEGLCTSCKKKIDTGKSTCDECVKRQKELRIIRIKRGGKC